MEIINQEFELKPLDKKKTGKLLQEVVAKLKMPYWISAGTALGLYRDGDFIKGDTDIDFAMHGYLGIDADLKNIIGGKLIREVYDEYKNFPELPMQLAFEKDGVILDFYFHWTNGKNLENHSESGWTRMKADICLKPQMIKTKYGVLPIPQKEYFEIRYGKDWKIPQDKKPIFYEI